VDIVAALPKTRSGKILRKTMRAIARGRNEQPTSTIDDPDVLDALHPVLRGLSPVRRFGAVTGRVHRSGDHGAPWLTASLGF
jgi:hypothetical protein